MTRVLFLGGLGRSGTTLLERLLGELPGVCPLGEVVHLWDRDIRDNERCACGRLFGDCEFWAEVGERAFGGWDRVDLARILALRGDVDRTRNVARLARRSGPARADVIEYAEHFRRVYAAAATVSGADLVVDSSKHAALAYCLRGTPDLDLRVVHVVRDSRGVAYSWTKRISRPETDGTEEMTRYSPGRSALLWNTHNAAFGLLARRGVPVLRLRYEALLADPAAALRALARFAGLGPSTMDFLVETEGGSRFAELGVSHSAAGNPMRFTLGPVPLRRDDAWRRALPAGHRRLVSALTAPMLRSYGYRLSGETP